MKSIKRALCSVLICFGTFVFCSSTANAAESAEVSLTEAADNNFVDNNVTENIVASQGTQDNKETAGTQEPDDTQKAGEAQDLIQTPMLQAQEVTQVQVMTGFPCIYPEQTNDTELTDDTGEQGIVAGGAKKSKSDEKKYNKADLRLLSAIIYCEANVEPYAGKLGVGIVIMNRVESKSFPNTIKKVIYQKSQFSPVRNGALKRALARYDAGKFKSKDEKQCIKAAKAALDGVKSVTYAGKEKSMKKYHYFSGSLRGSKLTIKGHKFK